jgi:hypothetical protein
MTSKPHRSCRQPSCSSMHPSWRSSQAAPADDLLCSCLCYSMWCQHEAGSPCCMLVVGRCHCMPSRPQRSACQWACACWCGPPNTQCQHAPPSSCTQMAQRVCQCTAPCTPRSRTIPSCPCGYRHTPPASASARAGSLFIPCMLLSGTVIALLWLCRGCAVCVRCAEHSSCLSSTVAVTHLSCVECNKRQPSSP